MAEETIRKLKDPDDLPAEAEDPEQEREGKVWGRICAARGINAVMVVREEHTDTEYVWVIDRERA